MKLLSFFLVSLASLLLASGQSEDTCASCLAASCHEVSTSTKVFISTLPCDGPVQVFTVTERPPAETVTITALQTSSSGSVTAAMLAASVSDGFSGVTSQSSPVTSTNSSSQAAINTAQAEDTGAALGSFQSPMTSEPVLIFSSTGRPPDVSHVYTTDVSSTNTAVVPSPNSASSPRGPATPASVSVSDAPVPSIMSGISVPAQGSSKADLTDAFGDTVLTFLTTTVSIDELTPGISVSTFTAILPTSQVGTPRITVSISPETTGTPASAASATMSSTAASNESASSGNDDALSTVGDGNQITPSIPSDATSTAQLPGVDMGAMVIVKTTISPGSTAQPTISPPGPPYQNVTLTMIGSEDPVDAISTTVSEAGNATTPSGMYPSFTQQTMGGVTNTAASDFSIPETGLIIPTVPTMSSSGAPYPNSTSSTDGFVQTSDIPALITGAATGSTSDPILAPMSTGDANSTYGQASTGNADASVTPSSTSIPSSTGGANATTILDDPSIAIPAAGMSPNTSGSFASSTAKTAGTNSSMSQDTPSTSESPTTATSTPAPTGTFSSTVAMASTSNPIVMETSSTAANSSSTLPPLLAVNSTGASDSSETSSLTITTPPAMNTTAATDPGFGPATTALTPPSPSNSTGTIDSSEASSPTITTPPVVNTTAATDPGSGPVTTVSTLTLPSNSSSSSSLSYSSAEFNNSSTGTSTTPASQDTIISTTESPLAPTPPTTTNTTLAPSPPFAFQDPSTGELASDSDENPFTAQFDPIETTAIFTLDAQGQLIYRSPRLANNKIASVSMSEGPVKWVPESALEPGYVPLKCTYTSGKLACVAVGQVVLGTFQFCENKDLFVTWGLQCPEVVVVEQ